MLKRGFTLLEVLISIMLLSLVLMALYKSSEILRKSNKNLFEHLEKSSNILKGSKTLYMDLIQSDGNITIDTKKDFHHFSIEKTNNSLYGLNQSKVTWLVYKELNTLLRIEGNGYNLPLKIEDNVAIDKIAKNIETFKIYRNKKNQKILIILKVLGEEAQNFMVQNISLEGFDPPFVHPTLKQNKKPLKKNKN
jgi:prepilin-type N-terminal cleavage/methylation domain-containing protein